MASPGRILLFLLLVLAVLGGLHTYLFLRLVRDPELPAPWARSLTWLFGVLATSLALALVGSRVLPRSTMSPIAWLAYTWLGLAFLLFLLVVSFDLLRAGLLLYREVAGAPSDPERRLFLSRGLAAVAALFGGGAGAFGLFEALGPVAVKRVHVPLARLAGRHRGYVIVQLTDIHVGPTIGRSFIEDLVKKVNALEPDLVAITGDLVDGSVAELASHVAPLAELRAKDGVFFVTGNHEYYSGASEWCAHLTSLGIRVLRNERLSLRDGLEIAGVDDWTAHQFGSGHGRNLSVAMSGRSPESVVILLAHQPLQVVEAAAHGVDLQLSGHTHGGQIFPWNFLVRLQQPYVAGLHRHGDTAIYVSSGTGYWGPPMRIGAPAEITRIELSPA